VTSEERPKSAIQDESAIRKADTVRSVRTDSDVALTVDGQITGTPAYMPPEQAEGKLEMIDHRSDVYSLGAILYEILTLERPIEGDTVHRVLLNVSEGKITPPEQRTPDRHVPKELSAIVMQAMQKNRRKRYQSVQDLSQDIKLFLEGRSVSARPDSFTEAFVKMVRRNRGVSFAVAVAAVLLVSVVSFSFVRITRAMQRAVKGEQEALAAQKEQRETALEASREMALQGVRAAEHSRWEEADVRAEAARKLAPEGPWGAYALGTVAKERRDFETAEAHYRTALKNDPAHRESEAALAQVLSAMGKLREATALLSGQGQIEDWYALKSAGDTLYGAERYREAEKAYTEALAQLDNPRRAPKEEKDWRSLVAAADALLAGEFYPGAKTAYERALTLMESAKSVPPDFLVLTKEKLKQARDGLSKVKKQIDDARGEAWAWVKCEGFSESIQDLPAEEQFARVRAKFDELHGKPVTGAHGITGGVLRFVQFRPWGVRYLQPLQGLALTTLYLCDTNVRNLAPLRGMPLKELSCGKTQVSDLTPLRGMLLTRLACYQTGVSDLSPLKGMPLRQLNCGNTEVSDLGPLRGMRLEELHCGSTRVTDLAPLEGMLLTSLDLNGSAGIADLAILKGMPLKSLNLDNTKVGDLGPLAGMPLTTLRCNGTQVSDLSPLHRMPLTELSCNSCTRVRDVSPLEGMPLESLSLFTCWGVRDLRPLKGMPLRTLNLARTAVSDLSPLEGMPLSWLRVWETKLRFC